MSLERKDRLPVKKPCPQCPFARATPKSYLDTMGDNGERFVGQALGNFALPCHMQKSFVDWRQNPTACNACAGAAIYRANCGYEHPSQIPHLPQDHENVFSSPEELLAHHLGVDLPEASRLLEVKPPKFMLLQELIKAGVIVMPK